jgi:hypothetical protein
MSSVQRNFAQRNGNNTQIMPVRLNTDLSFYDISGAAVYSVTIPKSQFVGGMYYVDLNDTDISGTPLNFDGRMYGVDISGANIPIIIFRVNIEAVPSVHPGLEVPVFFRNPPILTTIGIISDSSLAGATVPLPYIVSPPWVGPIVGTNISPSVTFKSDGENFDVVSSGPAGWFGVPALATLLTAYTALSII